MTGRATKPISRPRMARRKKSHNSKVSRSPRISRARLRMLRDGLEDTRNAVTGAFDKFWIIPEHDIRETLAKTQRKIRRAVSTLKKAA